MCDMFRLQKTSEFMESYFELKLFSYFYFRLKKKCVGICSAFELTGNCNYFIGELKLK